MSEDTSPIDISYRRIARIAWPVMLTQLSYTAMGVIDTMMVGQLGVTALAAVGLAALTIWWLLSFVVGTLSGVNTAVAQSIGARDPRSAGVAVWQGAYMGAVTMLLLLLLWPLVPVFLTWVDPSPGVRQIATEYVQIRLLGGIGLVPLVVADNFYRGLGRTAIPLQAALWQVLLNCGFNYLLIYGHFGLPAMGGAGAALGTILAQTLVGVVLFSSLLRGGVAREFHIPESWRLQPAALRALVVMSLPIGLQAFMEMGGVSVFSVLVARLGEAEMAATQAVIQNWSVAFMAGFGLSVCCTTLVGQAVGARQPEEARLAVGRVLRIGYALMGILAVAYVAFPEQLIAMFVRAEELPLLLPFARPMFLIVVVCLMLDLRFMVYWGALRGAGDTRFSMWVNIGSAWLLFVPSVAWVTTRYGVIASWACFVLHLAVMSTVLCLRFRGSAWLEHGLRKRVAEVGARASVAAPAEGQTE